MERAARQLALAPDAVGFTSILGVLDPETARSARRATDALRALLDQVQRDHTLNRALMSQELAFLDHLLGLAGGTGGYGAQPAGRGPGGGPAGADVPRVRRHASVVRRRVFDLEA